ncbi:LOW QUALITY PROTEIN: DAZ interacting zinc finger protein 1 [Aphomia sociella]
MASKASFELHHNFPKLAEESGFTFNNLRPRIHIDWNKIRLIDIDYLIKERKFNIVEQHMSDILNCVLESEFDVRILNESVLKMFRLAQLAVEYQQFCRHYLDRSVYVLREQISSLIQDLDVTKKELREKEEEIRKLKRKTKHTYRTPLPYGNDNIANMILKTLTNKNDMFASTSNVDTLQYNKCGYCDKVFLNQLYLKSHISRRHANVMETPEKDQTDNIQNKNNGDNSKLSEEIMELRAKLKEMEAVIKDTVSNQNAIEHKSGEINGNTDKIDVDKSISKIMKDVEVSTNNEDYLLDKIEEWKKEEHEKYNKEITLLRNQIMETISSFKEKENKTVVQNEANIIDQLYTTIHQQGAEILTLKQELNDSVKKNVENENGQRRKETEEQMTIWAKRAETQAKQYELLLKKLNDVAKEAQESRTQAEKEKAKAAQLQAILEHNLRNNNKSDNDDNSSDIAKKTPKRNKPDIDFKACSKFPLKSAKTGNHTSKSNPLTDRNTLEKLHLKAQELLSIASVSSSSSDVSSTEKNKPVILKPKGNKTTDKLEQQTHRKEKADSNKREIKNVEKSPNHIDRSFKNSPKKSTKEKNHVKESHSKKDKSKSYSNIGKNGPTVIARSPIKLVRAKITEEVNNRLVTAGMDPLKNSLSKSVFQKQRQLLQQQHEIKSKKNPDHDKVRHSILAYLDSTISKKEKPIPVDYVSPDKVSKTISLSSVLSNVKSKALSLVKPNDNNIKRKSLNPDVAKRAMFLLKTPPGSANSSPIIQQHSPIKENIDAIKELNENSNYEINNSESTHSRNKIKKPSVSSNPALDTSDSESTDVEHKYYKAMVQQTSKSVENLIKSPARRPASTNSNYNNVVKKYAFDNADVNPIHNSQSTTNISNIETDIIKEKFNTNSHEEILENDDSSEVIDSLKNVSLVKAISDENIHANAKQTKGVLKNASSMSSLNKKKVLFDMDAIQMKSVSASPSQSITEKSDANEKYELGLVNLDGEEWDISSIENEPLRSGPKIQVNTRTSPKIAALKQSIESQLARRNDTPSTVLVGGVDVLPGPMTRASSIGGSNTSLGSSILDDSDSIPATNHKAFVKPKLVAQKDDSELDISEFSIDGIGNKNESF